MTPCDRAEAVINPPNSQERLWNTAPNPGASFPGTQAKEALS